jgi:serine phosphatase RsbU (regulator of sigma subunit)
MFFPIIIRKIPLQYREEFFQRYANLNKNSVRLLCFLAIGIYSLATLISYFLYPRSFKTDEIPIFAMLVLSGIIIVFISKRLKTLKGAKAIAYIFTFLISMFITAIGIIYYQYIEVTSALYLFVFFLISFTIPWFPFEIIPVSSLYILSYSVLFIYARHEFSGLGIGINFERYIDGIIFLSMGCIFAIVIRRREFMRNVDNFIFLKEIEDKNKQMQKELELATRVHKTLIPNSISTDLLDIAVLYLPVSYMGGDYAKFRFINDDKLIFIICDVTGHGVSAALLVNRFHSEFERLARDGKNPGVLLKELNDFIVEEFQGINMYLSAFCGLLDFKHNKFSYSNHGHPSQYIYCIKKSDISILPSQTTLLGLPVKEDTVYEHSINFEKEDRILLFTDGVIEASNKTGQDYGEGRLQDFIRHNYNLNVEVFNQKLKDDLVSFNYGPFNDDIFILNIYIK